MAEYEDRERFIPFQKAEIVEMIKKDGTLKEKEQELFADFCKILQSLYHFEFHDKVESLKENYYPFNPDKDTITLRKYPEEKLKECEKNLVSQFQEVLNDANYEEVTEEDIRLALEEESLFKISLYVDFDDFDSYLLFWRGDKTDKVTIKKFFFFKKEILVPTFERIAMLIKFKDAEYFKKKKRKNIKFEPGSMVIKLFKNIPKADLEMLFPNTQVQMKLKDKLMMGGAALGGGIGVLLKASAGLIALVTVIWYLVTSFLTNGGIPELGKAQIAQMVGGLTALGVIGGFVWKQWTNYKNRTIRFMKALADNLYFKNLDNNVGVFHHIIDAAEEEEFKEAMLGYYFLLKSEKPLTEAELDDRIEEWFEKKYNVLIDFEVDDSLRKLKELKLCKEVGSNEKGEPLYEALTLQEGCERLDYIWDNYFSYNNNLDGGEN